MLGCTGRGWKSLLVHLIVFPCQPSWQFSLFLPQQGKKKENHSQLGKIFCSFCCHKWFFFLITAQHPENDSVNDFNKVGQLSDKKIYISSYPALSASQNNDLPDYTLLFLMVFRNADAWFLRHEYIFQVIFIFGYF